MEKMIAMGKQDVFKIYAEKLRFCRYTVIMILKSIIIFPNWLTV